MRRLLVFLLLLPLPAAAYDCPNAPWSSVSLEVKQDEVTTGTASLAELQTMHPPAMVHQHGEGVTLGLAASQFTTAYNLKYQLSHLPDGTYCAGVIGMDITLTFANNKIYVARELPPGSCIEREVMLHEKRHMMVDIDVARDWRYRLQQELYYAVKDIGIVRANAADAARDTLQQRIEPLMTRLIEKMMDDRSKRQALVDSRYEYERLGRACNGEGQKYVNAYLRGQ